MEGRNYADLVQGLARLEKGGLLGLESEGILPGKVPNTSTVDEPSSSSATSLSYEGSSGRPVLTSLLKKCQKVPETILDEVTEDQKS